jgi:hypothetical protein
MRPRASERLAQDNWRNRASFIVNGLTYGTGRIRLLELERIGDGEDRRTTVRLGGETTAEALTLRDPDAVTDLTVLCEAQAPTADLYLWGGEAGQGGDGFVALARKSDDYLLWLLFLDDSNPFVEVTFRDEEAWAVSTMDELWKIPLDQPERLRVSAGDPKGWHRPRLRL